MKELCSFPFRKRDRGVARTIPWWPLGPGQGLTLISLVSGLHFGGLAPQPILEGRLSAWFLEAKSPISKKDVSGPCRIRE
jgi:hypothetical protein